jgi:hypothetical protein
MSTITRLEFKNGAKKENKYIKNGVWFSFSIFYSFPLLFRYSSSYHLQGKTLYEVAKVLFAE